MKQLPQLALLAMLLLFHSCSKIQEPSDWEEDLDYLEREFPLKQLDFDKLMDPEFFSNEIGHIRDRLDELEEYEIVLELQKLFARMGVSHTGISFYYGSLFVKVPVSLELFDDGLFLTRLPSGEDAGPAHQILSINGFPTDTVIQRLSAYISYESPYWRDYILPHLVVMPRVLYHAGLSETTSLITYSLANGEELESMGNARSGQIAFMARLQNQPWQKLKNTYYWDTLMHDSILYIQYNTCQEDPQLSFSEFTETAVGHLKEHPVKTFILDVRLNHGGNSSVLNPLTEALKDFPELDIYVAMSRQTFSSGRFAVHDFQQDLGATLVGEPTGGAPASYGESRSLKLPNSGLQVNYCVKYFTLTDSELPYFEPDIAIPYVSADYFAGRDPVLEYFLGKDQ